MYVFSGLRVAFASGLVVLSLFLASPATAGNCLQTNGFWFMGMVQVSMNARGAASDIEYFNLALCSPNDGNGSSTSSWVAIAGNGDLEVYQIGYDKCQAGAFTDCPRANTPYNFYAYGREQTTACGPAVLPKTVIAPAGNVKATSRYMVDRVVTNGTAEYILYIKGVIQNRRLVRDIETCWPARKGALFLNEVQDRNDQAGGYVNNGQGWKNIDWKDGAGWRAFSRPFASTCDYHDLSSTMHCGTASNVHDSFFTNDTRFP